MLFAPRAGIADVQSVVNDSPLLESFMYPYLLTTGKSGWHEQLANGQISLSNIMRYRLQHVDRRFSECPMYVFAAVDRYIKSKITGAERFTIRNAARGIVIAGNVRTAHVGTTISRTIHSTPAYFFIDGTRPYSLERL